MYQQLRSHLAYLGLPGTTEALPTHLEQAHQQDIGHTEFLEGLLRVEVETTEQRRWETRLKLANFPTRWQLEDFDFATQPSIDQKLVRELTAGAYLADATNSGIGNGVLSFLSLNEKGAGELLFAGRAAPDSILQTTPLSRILLEGEIELLTRAPVTA